MSSREFCTESFDVIVVGGGHAGTEAACAAARMGAHTLLLTQQIEALGRLSCNPAIGGIGKGHLVKEIDALGGIMGVAADQAGIHFRTLNASRGPAVQATRAQMDRSCYQMTIRKALESQSNLRLFQDTVEDLELSDGEERVCGVITGMGFHFHAPCVVLTVGTFLSGMMHVGHRKVAGGRAGDPPANRLAAKLRDLSLNVGRLKTGTPPRLDGNSINYSALTVQLGDEPPPRFSFLDASSNTRLPQTNCHITHTNCKTHDIIRQALHDSPLYNGDISSVGPRYCPSIEDKIVRFSEREAHQIFLEPEGLHSSEVYPNGISTSLPFSAQRALVRSIAGLEHADITRPGYAIEYDFFDPKALTPWLENRAITGLFFAGQINGSTGYEEAAAQGLVAGINAALRMRESDPWYPSRGQAYLGVLISDLITHGVSEPYRMFTSRSEYRLLLREDNADTRLTEIGRQLGLVDDRRYEFFEKKSRAMQDLRKYLDETIIDPASPKADSVAAVLQQPFNKRANLTQLLARPEMNYVKLTQVAELSLPTVPFGAAIQVVTQIKYEGYLKQQEKEIQHWERDEKMLLPRDLDYQRISGLSNEAIEKLTAHQPHSLGSAALIPGVTAAAVSVLRVYLKKMTAH